MILMKIGTILGRKNIWKEQNQEWNKITAKHLDFGLTRTDKLITVKQYFFSLNKFMHQVLLIYTKTESHGIDYSCLNKNLLHLRLFAAIQFTWKDSTCNYPVRRQELFYQYLNTPVLMTHVKDILLILTLKISNIARRELMTFCGLTPITEIFLKTCPTTLKSVLNLVYTIKLLMPRVKNANRLVK